jgi:hypothetical protein
MTRRLPAGYEPAPEVVTTDFGTKAVGGDLSGVIGDLSFPAQPGQQLISKNTGDLCRTCLMPVENHMTSPASAVGYEPLGNQTPGVHIDVDTPSLTRNSADAYKDPRRDEFRVGRG